MNRAFEPRDDAEGEAFVARFCDRCRFDHGDDPCAILLRGASLPSDALDFPAEWVRDDRGEGLCTAFDPRPRADGAAVIVAEVRP